MKKHSSLNMTVIVLAALALGAGCGRDPLDAGIKAVENGNLPKAETLFAKVLEQDPGDVSALMNLSIVRLKTGNTEAALSGFRQVADQATEDVRPLAYMAEIYMDNNRWREATEILNEATRRDSRSPAIMTAQALVDLYTTGAASARDRLVHVLAMAPSYAPALFNMAVIERDWLKNPVEGRKYFQRYLAIAKNDSHTPIARAALLERATPPTRKAVSVEVPPTPAQKPAPALAPAPVPATVRDPKIATEAFTQAVRYHQSHDTDKAIREYYRALQNDPMMARAHFNLGLLLREKGDLEKARDSFEHALECAPGMTDARYMLGLILNTLGDDSRAITQFTTILEKVPNHAASHLALGLIYKKDKAKLALARKELSRYLELEPDGASAKEVKNWLKYQR
jgi:tetratricopeptide (TPR) repeat protein